MKFTLSWLKRFLDTDASVKTIVNTLNSIGLEVEDVVDRSAELKDFTVAEILETTPHPNADKLKVCKVRSADDILQIVCGAPNARAGIKVILAKVGSLIPNGHFKIKASEIRGVASHGMLCSANELMIGIDSSGIVELPTNAIIGQECAKYYGLDDPVIEISVTPNRGDCLGVYYIAKELAAKGIGSVIAIEKGGTVNTTFATLNICNIQNKPSPEWLQMLLKNIGQTPISAVVDITNYICISFARPIHAYDTDKLSGALNVDFATTSEKFAALNSKEYELSTEDLVIRDNNAVQALAGIIGGASSSCDMTTQNITLESAIFNSVAVAKSGRRHKIDTDSRHRFERGVDPAMVIPALTLAAQMIVEICGGNREEMICHPHEDKNPREKSLAFDIRELKRVTGLSLSREEIVPILQRLEFIILNHSFREDDKNILHLTIPSFRHDIHIQEDIVEEIIRIYGYEHLPLVALPDHHIARVLTNTQRRSADAKRMLTSRGYHELVTWSFMDSKKAAMFSAIRPELQLQNPISSELDYIRPTILPNILAAIQKNLARSIEDLAFFEVGPVFSDAETLSIAVARIGQMNEKNPHNTNRNVDVFDIKEDVELLLREMGIILDKCSFGDAPHYYHPYRSASINLGKNVLGYFGEIHPLILETYGIANAVVAFELNLNSIPEIKLKYGYKGIFAASDYQPVSRDFAFVVDVDHPVGGMISTIRNVDKKLIRDVSLFDVYTGNKIAQGKKSLAFNVLFQADDRTLNEDEINALSYSIIDTMEKKYQGELRV